MRIEDLPEGNVFLLAKYEDGSHFRDTNPFALARELDRLKVETVVANSIRSGALLIKTRTKSSAILLTQTTELLGRPITVEVADRLNTVEAVAHAPSLRSLSDQELIEELRPQGVIGVRRLGSRSGQRSPQLCLRFRGLTHPAYIRAGYERLPLRLWVRSPAMCRRCASFGHTEHWCRSEALCCLRCAAPHHTDECHEDTRFCPHCGGPHAAWDRSCTILQYRLRRAEEEQRADAGPPYDPSPNGSQGTPEPTPKKTTTTEDAETQTKTLLKTADAGTQTQPTNRKDTATSVKPNTSNKTTEFVRTSTKTTAAQTNELPVFDGIITHIEHPQEEHRDQPAAKKPEARDRQKQSPTRQPDQWLSGRTREERDADLPPAAGTRASYKERRAAHDGGWWTGPTGPARPSPTPDEQPTPEERPPTPPARTTRRATWWDD